uniref:Uncharacterized protein n=1 Tax=Spongospora subterranea TaxID=70186 RepID=A0A0H5QSA7_9EUKA|eukprot:CRZ04555.1 hypothetical protein [Spongospora subterranea]
MFIRACKDRNKSDGVVVSDRVAMRSPRYVSRTPNSADPAVKKIFWPAVNGIPFGNERRTAMAAIPCGDSKKKIAKRNGMGKERPSQTDNSSQWRDSCTTVHREVQTLLAERRLAWNFLCHARQEERARSHTSL